MTASRFGPLVACFALLVASPVASAEPPDEETREEAPDEQAREEAPDEEGAEPAVEAERPPPRLRSFPTIELDPPQAAGPPRQEPC